MAFIAGTQIFTDSGWKCIEKISGHDKVLVRNFLGDAEFIQPFALKKRQYDGEVYKIGGKNWSLSVTPEHIVVYDRPYTKQGSRFFYEEAQYLKPERRNRINRKFKYLASDEYKKESIVFNTPFGKKWVKISNEDWFVLVGYVLCRGYIEKASSKRYAVNIALDRDKIESELVLLGDILDRIGVEWSVIPSRTNGTFNLRVSAKSPLAKRLITRLGSKKRKEMYIPDSMIYTGSKELAGLLIETIIAASKKPTTERGEVYQFSSNNEKLIQSLQMLGTIWGYGMNVTVMSKKGIDYGQGPLKKDVMRLTIRNLAKSYSAQFIKKINYSNYVYAIDLFDGQVYVKEGSAPVWVNPK